MTAIVRRNPDPVIRSDDPWGEDPFHREEEGEILCALVESCANDPLVISLQSPWGSGKTVFLKRVAIHIERSRGIPAVLIDAWKSDDCDDPLATIVAELTELLERRAKEDWTLKATADKAISKLALYGSQVLLPGLSLVADIAAPGSGAALRLAGKYGSQLLHAQSARKEAANSFRSTLIEARDIITKRREGRPPRPMLLIIDELDRCRPDHAIQMLERVKHYFDVPGITFLIATDRNNLPSAVKTVYGEHVDGELYLRKFFDYDFYLRPPSAVTFARSLVVTNLYPKEELVDLASVLNGAHYSHELLARGQAVLTQQTAKFEYAEYFAQLSKVMELSLRDQGQAITILSAFIATRKNDLVTLPLIDCFVACFRFGFPGRFRGLLDSGKPSLIYDGQSADHVKMGRLGAWPLFPLVKAFFDLNHDNGDSDRSSLESMRKRANERDLRDPYAAFTSLFVLRIRTPRDSLRAYAVSVARLAGSLSQESTD